VVRYLRRQQPNRRRRDDSRYFDQFGAGAALRYVAVLPVMLVFVFAALFVYFRLRGGYLPVHPAHGEETTTA
jgi:hypothetical protein